MAFIYLLLAGAILAFGVYQRLVRNASLAVVGTYAYVNPIVAVGLGAIFLGEPITLRAVIAGVVIVVGVADRGCAGNGTGVTPGAAAACNDDDPRSDAPSIVRKEAVGGREAGKEQYEVAVAALLCAGCCK